MFVYILRFARSVVCQVGPDQQIICNKWGLGIKKDLMWHNGKMSASSQPQSLIDQAGESLAKDLRQFVFEGEVQAFHEAFIGYLTTHGYEDPHGRRVLSGVDFLHYPLSFRSANPTGQPSDPGTLDLVRWYGRFGFEVLSENQDGVQMRRRPQPGQAWERILAGSRNSDSPPVGGLVNQTQSAKRATP